MTIETDKLPQGWKWTALGEIILGKPQYGSVARKVPYNGKVRYVRITDLTDRGELKPDDPVSPSVVQPDRFLEPGDLLIARSGSVGRTYLHGNLPGTYQYAGYLIRFRIDPAKSLPGYVFYVSKSDLWREWIVSNSKTSTLTNINAKQYSSFRLPLPPLTEQKRIAGILNQQMAYVEKARQAAEEILDAAQALPGAFLRQAFPAHGDALPAGWKWTMLGDVLASIQPGFACGKRDEKGVAQLRMNNITTDGRFNWDKIVRIPPNYTNIFKYWLEPGDVLFNNTNSVELVGKSAIFLGFHEKVVYSNHFNRLRPDTNVLDTSYLANWLLYNWIHGLFARMCNRWVGQAAVPRSKLLALKIPLPPLPEQKRIAALLNEQMAYVETVRMSAREQLDAINALPAALLRRAFAGGL